MPFEIATYDEGPVRVSTGALPNPDTARQLIEAAYEHYRGVSDGVVASYIPALRATRVDPIVVLKSE